MFKKNKRIFSICILLILFFGLPGITGCSSSSNAVNSSEKSTGSVELGTNTGINAGAETGEKELTDGAAISKELTYKCSMDTEYAEEFRVDYYEDANGASYTSLQTIPHETVILVVPEGGNVPGDLDESVIVLKKPVKNLYLVASAAMDMFVNLDALDSIRFSGQKKENWYIPEAAAAMEKGDILYAGKYSKPDYELIVSNGCSMAIENTMIFHSPDVIEQLGNFGIPVIVDYSSSESHPLARVEWIRFYGALLGLEDKADESEDKTDLTVAYFYITSNNLVQVRKTTDYIPKMIEIAGGKYIFDETEDDGTNKSTVNMQLEEFYDSAKDADIIIYNSSIDGGVETVEELKDKWALLADFKAVKEGNVWCTTNDSYQQSMAIGYMIEDMHKVISGGEEGLHYIYKLK